MAQRYGQNDYQGGRESNRDSGQAWQSEGRERQSTQQDHPRYGAQGDFGSSGNYEAFGNQGSRSGYGSQQGQDYRQRQAYAPGSSQYGGSGYGQEGYGSNSGSGSQVSGHYAPHQGQGRQGDSGYANQGAPRGPDSAPYYGAGPSGGGRGEYGRQSDYGAFGAQGYGGEGGSGSQGYGGQGAYARYGSQGNYGTPGGYGDQGNRQGDFGARSRDIDEQVRRGSMTAYAGQVNYGEGVYGGYGIAGHGSTSGREGLSWGDWGSTGLIGRQRRAPKGYQRSDERLHEDICERLMNRWDIDAGEVSVQVQGGNVTLEGTVDSRRERHMIEDIVDDCHGVKDIDNRIRVQRAGQNSPQTWDEAIHNDSGSGRPSNEASRSGQSSSTGATLGAETGSSAPAMSASNVGDKKKS
jgi:osmotically-inducible protein OsmY